LFPAVRLLPISNFCDWPVVRSCSHQPPQSDSVLDPLSVQRNIHMHVTSQLHACYEHTNSRPSSGIPSCWPRNIRLLLMDFAQDGSSPLQSDHPDCNTRLRRSSTICTVALVLLLHESHCRRFPAHQELQEADHSVASVPLASRLSDNFPKQLSGL
jgi:hypothetical protein